MGIPTSEISTQNTIIIPKQHSNIHSLPSENASCDTLCGLIIKSQRYGDLKLAKTRLRECKAVFSRRPRTNDDLARRTGVRADVPDFYCRMQIITLISACFELDWLEIEDSRAFYCDSGSLEQVLPRHRGPGVFCATCAREARRGGRRRRVLRRSACECTTLGQFL